MMADKHEDAEDLKWLALANIQSRSSIQIRVNQSSDRLIL